MADEVRELKLKIRRLQHRVRQLEPHEPCKNCSEPRSAHPYSWNSTYSAKVGSGVGYRGHLCEGKF